MVCRLRGTRPPRRLRSLSTIIKCNARARSCRLRPRNPARFYPNLEGPPGTAPEKLDFAYPDVVSCRSPKGSFIRKQTVL